MAIIQISKIQQRSGNLVDLPQLNEAELGFAADVNKLYIGKTSGNTENIEVLTAYSNISFSQLEGGEGNLNIDLLTLEEGQVLAYDETANAWENRGGNSGGLINLGELGNLSIDGGSVGYVLTTDGFGNLQWTPKGVVAINIQNISQNSTARVTLEQPFPFAIGTEITINGITGSGDFPTLVNGNQFYIKPVNGNLQLYDLFTDTGITIPFNTSNYTPAYSNGGKLIFNTVLANGEPGGVNNSVQFNSGAGFAGDGSFLYDFANTTLSVPTANIGTANIGTANIGTANIGNILGNGAGIFSLNASNITTGTLAQARLANSTLTLGNTILTLGNTTTTVTGLSSVSSTTFVGTLSGAATTSGTVTTNAQPNITSVGTLTSLTVSGNVSGGNIAGIIRPTAGNGTAGIIFPADPGGGSGDLATIKYYALAGETTLLELAVTNDPDDRIYLNATGGTNVAGTLQTTAISTGASATAGSLTGNWSLTAGSRLQSTYADLAEYYSADDHYIVGTVLEFGGEKEVTLAGIESNKIAGIVSAEPAYVMNGNIQCDHPVIIALLGRVPCKVIGRVSKGDLMISAGNGFAKTSISTPKIGTVIGKALQNFDGEEGIIEVVVGRL